MSTDATIAPGKPETAKPAKTAAHQADCSAPVEAGITCPCGKTHKPDPVLVRAINAAGPVAVMHGPEGSYRVPRVFAANHDVTAQNLQASADKYGFETA